MATTGKLLRRKKDGGYESFAYDGSNTSADPSLSERTAREMWAKGGYDEVGDADFEALRRVAYGQPDTAAEDFRVGAPKVTLRTPEERAAAEQKPGYAKWAEEDFRAGAPKVGREQDFHDAKMDGLSNPRARLAQDWMDAPRNPMPPAGMKTGGKGRPGISVGMPAAAREGAGRFPGATPMPAGAQKAMASATSSPSDVTRAVDPYGEARAASSRNRLGVQLARAGAMANEALSGARYDREAYGGLDAQAEESMADYVARRDMARQQASDAAALEERRLRAEDYARRWASGDRDFKYRQGRDTAEDTLARDKMAADERRWRAELGARSADRNEARQARLDARTAAEEERNERARLAREAKERDMSDKALQTLGQQTSKLPIGELQQALESIETQAPGMAYGRAPEDNPLSVKDRFARRVPFGAGEWAMSDEGKRYSTSVAQLRDLVTRMRSGAAINASEEKHYLSLLSDNILSDPQKAAYGINSVREGLAQRLRNIQAPYVRGGTLDEYERQGGSSFRAPIFSGEAPPPVARPTGRTVTRRDGSVWEELSDGSARRAR